jgi:hypothetical protein
MEQGCTVFGQKYDFNWAKIRDNHNIQSVGRGNGILFYRRKEHINEFKLALRGERKERG